MNSEAGPEAMNPAPAVPEPMQSTPAPAPTAPVAATGGARWLLAFGLAGLALVITAAGILLLGSRATPEALRYVPADMSIVAELRMDLPGDQLEKVGNLLAHFPGFKDQSILPDKITESLDKIVRQASGGTADYVTKIQPWLAGPLFAGAEPTSTSAQTLGPTGSLGNRGVVVFTTNGAVTCDPFTQGSTATELHNGITIHDGPAGDAGTAACALDGRYAIVGDSVSVKAALDAHANHVGMDGNSQYQAARDALGQDRLATIYFSVRALATGALNGALPNALEGVLSSDLPTQPPEVTNALAALPAWAIAGIRAEDSALVADFVTAPIGTLPGPSGSPYLTMPPAHASRLAAILPADTAVLYDVHGAGAAIQNALTAVRAQPQLGAPFGQLDATLGVLGGSAGLVGWIDDAGIVAVPDGSSVTGGVILIAADDATATAKADQVRSLLTLAAIGGSVDVHDTVINGTKVTTADLGDATGLLQQAGVPGLAIPPGSHVAISFATHGAALIVGAGEGFVRHVLETASGSSLADQPSYKTALGLAQAENTGELYIAFQALTPLIEANIPAGDRPAYESDAKPYLAPFDSFLETMSQANGGLRLRFVVTVK